MPAAKSTNKPLSALRLGNLKRGDTASDTWEHRGLWVSRNETGARYWYRYKHPITGKLVELTLFTKDAKALAEARVVFAGLKLQRANGGVPELPAGYRKASVLEDVPKLELPTAKTIVTVYVTDHVYRNRKLKGAKETDRVLVGHVADRIGDTRADQVSRQTVLDLVRRQIKAGHNAQAGVILRELDAAFEFAVDTGALPEDFVDPARLAKRSLRQAKTKLTANRRQRCLTDSELKSFLAWLPASAFSRNQRYAEEGGEWLQKWAGHLDILRPAKIARLKLVN